MNKEVIFTPHFVFKDYLKVNLFLFLTSRYGVIFYIIDILFLGYFTYYYAIGAFALSDLLLLYSIALIFYPILIFITRYIQTKRSLQDPRLKENITFKVNEKHLEDSGENYTRNFIWSELLKIKETNNFFLIYVTKHMVKVIRKADLKGNQYNEIKAIFNSLDIKKSLK